MEGVGDALAILRDVAIIVLAIETLVVGAAVLVLVLQAIKLVKLGRAQIQRLTDLGADVLGTTAEAARSVRGTTAFVGDRAARPLIELISVVTAARHFARAAFGFGRNERHEEKP